MDIFKPCMAYVYRHIRLDKNVPFYIGISSDPEGNYRRSKNATRDKSYIWRRIVAKTEYEIEIMIEGLTWEQACEKEKEFIQLYGRVNKKTGTLANLTDGGEGNYGLVVTKETKELLSDINSIPIVQYDLDGKFIKVHKGSVEAAKSFSGSVTPIWGCANFLKHYFTAYGFLWRKYEGHTNNIFFDRAMYNKTVFGKKTIKVYAKNGCFIETCESVAFASRKYDVSSCDISSVLSGSRIAVDKYIFRYDDGDYSNIDTIELYRHINATKRKKVVKIDIESGKEIEIYESITIAAKANEKAFASSISACCRGFMSKSGGFKWQFKV